MAGFWYRLLGVLLFGGFRRYNSMLRNCFVAEGSRSFDLAKLDVPITSPAAKTDSFDYFSGGHSMVQNIAECVVAGCS
jgi:hypothetical protein